jgi:hypothetical protein
MLHTTCTTVQPPPPRTVPATSSAPPSLKVLRAHTSTRRHHLPTCLACVQVLCASNDAHDQVDPVIVPEGAAIGERIKVEGFDSEPLAEVNPKKKILERLFPDMKTDVSEWRTP